MPTPNSWWQFSPCKNMITVWKCESCFPEVFLRKYFPQTCSKFTREHPYQSAISIKLLYNFIEIWLRHGCSPVNLVHIFRALFYKNPSGGLILKIYSFKADLWKMEYRFWKCWSLLSSACWDIFRKKKFLNCRQSKSIIQYS